MSESIDTDEIRDTAFVGGSTILQLVDEVDRLRAERDEARRLCLAYREWALGEDTSSMPDDLTFPWEGR